MGNRRSKKLIRIIAVIIAIAMIVTTLLGSFMYMVWADTAEDYVRPVNYGKKVSSEQYMRGVWVSSVYSLDYPSIQTKNSSKLKRDIDDIVKNCVEMGINTIFFQVRPTSDALYKSDVYPWSKYLTGTQGVAPENGFDPLAYFVTAAHQKGIELHAWINPYRITQSGDAEFEAMSESKPAKSTHSDYVVAHNGNYYFDPAEPAVRQLIIDGACEIARKYDVDGVHLDDYFYPGTDFDDADSFALYGEGWDDIGDWRRNNVNLLISELDKELHKIDRNLRFGVSPAGIWENQKNHPEGSATDGTGTYSKKYCDSLKWIKEGWVDYIVPQIYWHVGYEIADYKVLLDWWSNAVKGTDVELYIGMADYKTTGVTDETSPWYSTYEMQKQMCLNGADKNIAGEIHFRYKSMAEDTDLKALYEEWYTGKNAVSRDTPLDLSVPPSEEQDPEDSSTDPEPLPEVTLKDIDGHWAETYIRALAAKGIVSGMGDDMFIPEGNVTRAQFVKMIAGVAGVTDFSDVPDAGFSDVGPSDWHRDYINWAAHNGIVKGVGDGFAPDAQITREQMAVIIVNFAKSQGLELGSSIPSAFADQSDISSWASDAVAAAASAGIINGIDTADSFGCITKYFQPQHSATRAQAAKMIYMII